jgi:putative transposase
MEPRRSESTEYTQHDLSWLIGQPMEVKAELLRHHLSICQIVAWHIMQEEVTSLCGERYSRDRPKGNHYCRWSTNPGSIKVGDTKVAVQVPRVRDMVQEECVPLSSYDRMQQLDSPTEQIVQGVLKGLSMRDYQGVVDHLGEGFGLSKSEVSRQFVELTAESVKAFFERDLSNEQWVAMFIDGKSLAKEQMIVALGVTHDGKKIPVGFVQSHSEKAEPVIDMLKDVQRRGVPIDKILYIVDGSKGFRKAIKSACGSRGLIQRCIWHKLENIKSHLAEKEHEQVRSDYYAALDQESHEDAQADLLALEARLRPINVAAANSLLEGMDELLTLHQLKIPLKLRQHFRTTNCIENLNSQLVKYTHKVKYWKNSEQRYRWIAAGLLEVEKKMRRMSNYRLIPLLKEKVLLHYSNGTS